MYLSENNSKWGLFILSERWGGWPFLLKILHHFDYLWNFGRACNAQQSKNESTFSKKSQE